MDRNFPNSLPPNVVRVRINTVRSVPARDVIEWGAALSNDILEIPSLPSGTQITLRFLGSGSPIDAEFLFDVIATGIDFLKVVRELVGAFKDPSSRVATKTRELLKNFEGNGVSVDNCDLRDPIFLQRETLLSDLPTITGQVSGMLEISGSAAGRVGIGQIIFRDGQFATIESKQVFIDSAGNLHEVASMPDDQAVHGPAYVTARVRRDGRWAILAVEAPDVFRPKIGEDTWIESMGHFERNGDQLNFITQAGESYSFARDLGLLPIGSNLNVEGWLRMNSDDAPAALYPMQVFD